VHGVSAHAGGLGQAPHAPLGCVRWTSVARGFHHPEAIGLRVHPRPAWVGLIGQPGQSVADEPLPPAGDHRPR
jgi:hypothetical protein